MVMAGSLHAAADYFLEIDGIKGESSDSRHPESVEVFSFSWGASNDAASGGGAGKVSFSDFSFTTKVSKASPKLMLACATGQHISHATLYLRRDENDPEDYIIIEMSDILISSVQQRGQTRDDLATSQSGTTSGDADDRPTEEVAFYYNRVAFTYIGPDGTSTTVEASRPAPQ